MPLTFLLLQLTNFLLAGASVWIHYKAPMLWNDQAQVISTLAGSFCASMTAIFLGIAIMFEEKPKWISSLIHIFLSLIFGSLQGYLFYLMSKDTGFFNFIKSQLGL